MGRRSGGGPRLAASLAAARASIRVAAIASALLSLPVSAYAQAPVEGLLGGPTVAIDAQIAEATSELERASAARDRVGAEIDGLVAQREAAQRRLRARVNVLTRARRAGLLPLAEGFDALVRHRARLERLERMVVRDAAALRALEGRVAALRDEGARLAGEAARREATVASLRERRAMLERATLGAWAGIDPNDPSAPSDGWGLRLSDGGAIGPSFAERRGRLPIPVGGSAQLREAEREGGRGVELVAAPGVHVRAVAPGRVAYAASHPAYGVLVIVDHGEGYYSVYGGLGALAVSVGASVGSESALGTTGASPIFFQVRRGTRPMPAREWLGI